MWGKIIFLGLCLGMALSVPAFIAGELLAVRECNAYFHNAFNHLYQQDTLWYNGFNFSALNESLNSWRESKGIK